MVNPNTELPAPAATMPIDAVTLNVEPDGFETKSVTRGSEQAAETTYAVRIQLQQTSTGEGTITGMPADRAIKMLDDLLGKQSITQLRKISDRKVMITLNNTEGSMNLCTKSS